MKAKNLCFQLFFDEQKVFGTKRGAKSFRTNVRPYVLLLSEKSHF